MHSMESGAQKTPNAAPALEAKNKLTDQAGQARKSSISDVQEQRTPSKSQNLLRGERLGLSIMVPEGNGNVGPPF